jgi:hypothetical protein
MINIMSSAELFNNKFSSESLYFIIYMYDINWKILILFWSHN